MRIRSPINPKQSVVTFPGEFPFFAVDRVVRREGYRLVWVPPHDLRSQGRFEVIRAGSAIEAQLTEGRGEPEVQAKMDREGAGI